MGLFFTCKKLRRNENATSAKETKGRGNGEEGKRVIGHSFFGDGCRLVYRVVMGSCLFIVFITLGGEKDAHS
jgi:hypothetical protein